MHLLIVHGPNLNLLGESKGDCCSFAELNARLEAFARELGATVEIVQSNHEGVLLDAIQAARSRADAVLINPAALTHTSYALRECLRVVGKPVVEVHLEDIRRRETWRRRSVIKDICEAQVMGKGLVSYLDGMERLVTGRYRGLRQGKARAAAERPLSAPAKAPKSLGPKGVPAGDPARLLQQAARASEAPPPPRPAKTLGRASPATRAAVPAAAAAITRAAVRARIGELLGRRISPASLATWAREQWLNVERGAATEMGQRELLSEALQTLALSAVPAGRLSEGELLEWMTRLD